MASFKRGRVMRRLCAAVFVLLTVLSETTEAQFDNVGSIQFPTSATGEAQQHFLRGVSILHSFGWKQAREKFHAAQEIDPNFALAYWGESLAYNHPLVSQMDTTEPRKALARLAPTRAERLAKAPTDREKGFLNAVEILWGEDEHMARRVGYMEAMADLYEQYPEDPEVAAFYSLSMLGAVAATGDLSQRLNVRAGSIALELFKDNPNHPGAAHYTIHSFDNPLMAPLALEAAYQFSKIAPAISHARHMPTHIFIQHGMWTRVSGNNQSAYDAAAELWQPGDALGDGIHALDWGQYGDLQRGDYEKARVWMTRLDDMVAMNGYSSGGARGAAGIDRARNSVSLLKARYIVETEEWNILPITAESRAHELLATGLSAARMGDQDNLAAAESALSKLAESGNNANKIMYKEVSALLHAGMGHGDFAISLMDEAVAIVETMAPPRGSASPVKPVYELYGELLLDLNRPGDAIEKFETSLTRMPLRPRSLLGLARANAATENYADAAEAYARLTEIWTGHDSFEAMQEAKEFLETTDYQP